MSIPNSKVLFFVLLLIKLLVKKILSDAAHLINFDLLLGDVYR